MHPSLEQYTSIPILFHHVLTFRLRGSDVSKASIAWPYITSLDRSRDISLYTDLERMKGAAKSESCL